MIPLRALGGANIEQFYPTVLADEINLDSPDELKQMMIRTADDMMGFCNLHNKTYPLLGANPDEIIHGYRPPQGPLKRTAIDSPKRLYEACMRDPERLLNSRSGRIHLFPCVPAWSTVAFRGFQARGGFLVSAEMQKGEVAWARITARRNTICTIKTPWPHRGTVIRDLDSGEAITPLAEDGDNDSVRFKAIKGVEYELRPR
jgi:hypothetical protein